MRSARMLFATAAATAVLAITAPGAYADGDEWKGEDHGYSKEHHKEGKHDGPHGGVHTGGGALTATQNDEWSSEGKEDKSWGDEDKKKDEGREESSYGKEWKDDSEKESWKGDKDGWKGDHDKPRGGMHTGGGGLASPAMTAGGLAVLAVAGTGMYALRRKNIGGSAA
ncbi:hypothetical protein [Streptomyces neyagawaensis]|uniref:hypothetical protein n=1 Tax=Streptomyces neyagawaensis TaxID=42238 RepID=UPI0006E362D6|nr:hypothetical protein [Streptomyces neyagawaensis]MCL6731274.1 hypothetical protein [Streptomyces neyagawaensis]MDE1683602.1 hypothetical protein [Streptomyces neyagawaensis]